MNIETAPALMCPICRAQSDRQVPLHVAAGRHWQCAQGHHFDQAKQGYVNLLSAQFKRSKDPGDSKLMVQARRRFLDAGYYQPIAEQLTRLVQAQQHEQQRLHILDAGCGEGYYLRQLAQGLHGDYQLLGNDVSKWAVQSAAAANKSGHYVVASNARLPYPDDSLDVLICAFGFTAAEEFARVVKPQGVVITLDPLAAHLQALRAVLYPESKSKTAEGARQLAGFHLRQQVRLSFPLKLSQNALQDLLAMTPHAYRAPHSGKQQLATLDTLELETEVMFQVWQPCSTHLSAEQPVN